MEVNLKQSGHLRGYPDDAGERPSAEAGAEVLDGEPRRGAGAEPDHHAALHELVHRELGGIEEADNIGFVAVGGGGTGDRTPRRTAVARGG